MVDIVFILAFTKRRHISEQISDFYLSIYLFISFYTSDIKNIKKYMFILLTSFIVCMKWNQEEVM